MNARSLYALPLAGAFAVAGACAGARARTPAEQTRAAEEQSQQAYSQAAKDQEQLADQQKRAEAAHQEVLKVRQQLALAETHEEQERARTEQLKKQAQQHLEEARLQAQRAYGASTRGMGQGNASGRVAQAAPGEIVLETPTGGRMTFHVDDRTKVLIGGEERSASDIQRGADALVAYDTLPGGQQNAVTIQVRPAQPLHEQPTQEQQPTQEPPEGQPTPAQPMHQ